jgi:hypothetical protein
MSQRVTLDRQSFEQFLAATCLLQQLRQEARRHHMADTLAPDDIVGDIYVPGIGVRAALGGDFAENSRFWPTLRDNAGRATQIARDSVGLLFGGARNAGLRLLGSIKNASGKLRRDANFVAAFPSAANESLLRSLRHGKSALLKAVTHMHPPHRTPVNQVPELPAPFEAAGHRRVEQVGAMRLRGPIAPRHLVLRYWRRAQSLLLDVWKNVVLQFRKVLRYQPVLPGIRIKTAANRSLINLRFKLDLKDIARFAPAWAVLLIILLFVAVEQGMHKSSPSASPVAVNTAQASTLPIGRISPKPHPTPSKVHPATDATAQVSARPAANRPFQLSHLQITDPATKLELRDMTRYEVAKLQKDAQSGDNVAAFQLGMAYEIGYDVPQNCAEAAKWVARSAVQGNAAAEYNLGLRYRDGDGVTANPSEAEKWLRQAAAQNHSAAQLALLALTAHQTQKSILQP